MEEERKTSREGTKLNPSENGATTDSDDPRNFPRTGETQTIHVSVRVTRGSQSSPVQSYPVPVPLQHCPPWIGWIDHGCPRSLARSLFLEPTNNNPRNSTWAAIHLFRVSHVSTSAAVCVSLPQLFSPSVSALVPVVADVVGGYGRYKYLSGEDRCGWRVWYGMVWYGMQYRSVVRTGDDLR
jgi:hypothetical protein